MAAARFWRLQGVETYGYLADLELSELALYEGATRVDGIATLTSTFTPTSGALANLQDGDLGTVARFLGTDVFSPAFAIDWDFGAGVAKDISELRIGSGTSEWWWMHQFTLRSSSDGAVWTPEFFALGLAYPGNATLVTLSGGETAVSYSYAGYDPHAANVVLHMPMDGVNGGTTFIDLTGKTVTPTVCTTSTVQSKYGGSSALFNGSSSYLSIPSSADFAFGLDDFTMECWIYVVGTPANYVALMSKGQTSASGAPFLFFLLSDVGGISRPYLQLSNGSGLNYMAGVPKATSETWTHFAVVRAAGQVKFFTDGSPSSATTQNYSLPTTGDNVQLGRFASGLYPLKGYLDDVRITKGVARYSGSFTPKRCETGLLSLQPASTKRLGMGQSTPAIVNPQAIGNTQLAYQTPLVLSKDMQYGGRGLVTGTVKQKALPSNTPLGRRVRLVSECDNALVRETWSDTTTGDYEFPDVDPTLAYTVITYDYAQNYRAVIADNLTLANGGVELMP